MRWRYFSSVLLLLSFLGGNVARAQDDGSGNQIQENLSAYTGVNAKGYLGPLRDMLGSSLNSGLYASGGVPRSGLHVRVEAKGMLVFFGDSDRTFRATTESYFGDPQTTTAPTVVGSETAVEVTNPTTGATFFFPGGLNVKRFALAAPQITVGSVMGTEAIARYVAVNTGDSDFGDITLTGFGARHCVSNWIPELPVDLSALFFWQRFEMGEDFLEATTITFGAQAGKTFGPLDAYGGLSYDSIDMDVTYDSEILGREETINVDFGRKNTAHLTLGATLNLWLLHLTGEYNQASQRSLTFGLGLGL